jgi:hypothetical protein
VMVASVKNVMCVFMIGKFGECNLLAGCVSHQTSGRPDADPDRPVVQKFGTQPSLGISFGVQPMHPQKFRIHRDLIRAQPDCSDLLRGQAEEDRAVD